MIYLDNDGRTQTVYIPRASFDASKVSTGVDLSNYYTIEQVDEIVANAETPVMMIDADGTFRGDYSTVLRMIDNEEQGYLIYVQPFERGAYVSALAGRKDGDGRGAVMCSYINEVMDISWRGLDAESGVFSKQVMPVSIYENDAEYTTKKEVDNTISDYLMEYRFEAIDMFYPRIDGESLDYRVEKDAGRISDLTQTVSGLDMRITELENGGGSGGSGDVDWNNVPYIHVAGTAQFDSEIVMAGGGQSGDSDIASGIACAFKAGKTQSIDLWTRTIHMGTDGEAISFVGPSEYNYEEAYVKITPEGICENGKYLSDKYALKGEGGDMSKYYTKDEIDALVGDINNILTTI